MKRWRWVTIVAVALLGLVAGVAIGGQPEVPVDYVLAEPRSARVVVASASGNSETAEQAAGVLRGSGWMTVSVRTVVSDPGGITRVYATSARTAEAQQAALQLQLDSATVLPLPGDALVTPTDANDEVIIILGDDYSG